MQFNYTKEAKRIRQLFDSDPKILITSHHNPDGDAIGSMLGLHFILKELGVNSTMVLPNDVPDFLSWLPRAKYIVKFSKSKDKAKDLFENATVIFALDFNGTSRLEGLSEYFVNSKATKILIDHHPYPEKSFDIYVSNTNASSTAEIVYELALALKDSSIVPQSAAVSLFTGIMTDTGSFSYACSNPRTFEIVAQLITKGVNIDQVQQNVYNNFSASRMRLLGYSLQSKMKVYPEKRSAYISLSRNELKEFKYNIGDTEGIVNYPLSIKNIVFSALFIENANFIKVSLSSIGDFPANKICEEFFNGGGHRNAAGGKSYTSMEETEALFEKILEKYQTELVK